MQYSTFAGSPSGGGVRTLPGITQEDTVMYICVKTIDDVIDHDCVGGWWYVKVQTGTIDGIRPNAGPVVGGSVEDEIQI